MSSALICRWVKAKSPLKQAHAAISAAQDAYVHHKKWWDAWLFEGQKKVALKVATEKELCELEEAAEDLGLPHALIIDRGLTQIPEGSITCLGIGPAPSGMIDRLTGQLKLL